MRVAAGRVDDFLRRPDPRAGAVLLYGPDGGLVRERAERLLAQAVDDPRDPFRVGELSAEAVRADPARLVDEARALSLTGGRRVVRLRQAADAVAAACRELLRLPALEALVIVEAGDLGPGSGLRRLFEQADNAAALPCYRDEGQGLAGLIKGLLAEHGLSAQPDALAYLVDHLGADRGLTRSEIDKLALLLDDGAGRTTVTLDDAAAAVGDGAAFALDDVVHAAASGEPDRLERSLERLFGEGQHPVRIVRALANHMDRLRRLGLEVAAGKAPERAVEDARPPIHFRRRDEVRTQLRRWPPDAAVAALGDLIEAEVRCKTTGLPAATVCREAAFALCLRAAG
ncbi:MAG TPA: DNA polymerase III subunit delta [Geminicoccaceae bacterium]|nr:DNA polymerase III subunit delta [Geminicoccaceae bacterium]